MIVVRANLYRGEAKRARSRRPKTIAAAAAAVMIFALLLSDYTEGRGVAVLRRQALAAGDHARGLKLDLEAARAADAQIQKSVARRDAILALASRRQNWAPVLAQALASVPPTAELVSLRVDSGGHGGPRVRIAGRCAGAQPRLEADKCLLQMTHAFASAGLPMAGRFESLEDAPAPRPGEARPYAVADFVIQFASGGDAHAN